MKALLAFLGALVVPLVLLNLLGGIVSGIWLAILGEWRVILLGFIGLLVAGVVFLFALMPVGLLGFAAVGCWENGNRMVSYMLGFLSTLCGIAVVTAWCMAVLYFFGGLANDASKIPVLIWSYGVAIGPLRSLARQDAQTGEPGASIIAAFLAALAYLVVVLMALLGEATLRQCATVFLSIMVVGLVINFFASVSALSELGSELTDKT